MNLKSKKKLNSVQIQNDNSVSSDLPVDYFTCKQNCIDSETVKYCCTLRRQLKKLLAGVQIEKTRFFGFAILRYCNKNSKKVFTQDDRTFGIKQFCKHDR